ncbi:response regulator [Effusibacillus pohliae]|uniref:response regulator n=1 Tax=Effusibacillus pohliae TaxID=232270 RepID=UPI000361DDF2|nr:response regulator [Effusibacillus pohliae]
MEAIKVLVADNYPDFANLLEEFIGQQRDMRVTGVAYNGYEVLEMIEAHAPDVVILDVIMPVLDGIGVLEKMQTMSLKSCPKIIMLTSLTQAKIVERGFELGASHFLFKPCDLNIVADHIRQLTQGCSDLGVLQSPIHQIG